MLRTARIGGVVEVHLTIDETGRVTQAAAVTGPALLRAAAERAVRTWVYRTGDGKRRANSRPRRWSVFTSIESSGERERLRRVIVLSPEQKATYKASARQLSSISNRSMKTLRPNCARVKKRLLELQEEKRAVKQVLDGASARLGLPAAPPLKDLNLSDLSRLGTRSSDAASHSQPVTVP